MNRNEISSSVIQLILTKKFLPGQRLPVDKLADILNTSHTPIRESLSALSRDGIVVRVPGQGFFVPLYNENDISNLYEFLYVLLSASLHKIMNIMNLQDIQSVFEERHLIDMIEDRGTWLDRDQSQSCMETIFVHISELSGNSLIANSMRSCVLKTSFLRQIEYGEKARRNSVRDDVISILDYMYEIDRKQLSRRLISSHSHKNQIISDVYKEYAVAVCNAKQARF